MNIPKEKKEILEVILAEVKENKKSIRMSKPAWELIKVILEKIKIV